MSWSQSKHCLVCLILCLWSAGAIAVGEDADTMQPTGEAFLVTYGPGEIYWQRFGHNAIWLREPALDLDHTINFGFFDFAQTNFFWRFVQGRMLYFSAAQPVGREFESYRAENRSIRTQRLELSANQYRNLRDTLLFDIRPENREYLYDYYANNCSTRVRDVIDDILGGALKRATASVPADQNLRTHTQRLVQQDLWLYLGLETALGRPLDRPVSRWDEMFLPEVVSQVLELDDVLNPDTGKPLVSSAEFVFEPAEPLPTVTPEVRWPVYLLLAGTFGLLLSLSARIMPPVWGNSLALVWMLIGGSAGLFIVFAWFMTDHEAARWNANLLLLHPLMLLALFPRMRKTVVMLSTTTALLALVARWIPGHQYTDDVLAAVLPLSLLAHWRVWTMRPVRK
jgi:hypothetical protein